MKIPDDLKDQLTEYRNIPILQKPFTSSKRGKNQYRNLIHSPIQNIQIQAAKWS